MSSVKSLRRLCVFLFLFVFFMETTRASRMGPGRMRSDLPDDNIALESGASREEVHRSIAHEFVSADPFVNFDRKTDEQVSEHKASGGEDEAAKEAKRNRASLQRPLGVDKSDNSHKEEEAKAKKEALDKLLEISGRKEQQVHRAQKRLDDGIDELIDDDDKRSRLPSRRRMRMHLRKSRPSDRTKSSNPDDDDKPSVRRLLSRRRVMPDAKVQDGDDNDVDNDDVANEEHRQVEKTKRVRVKPHDRFQSNRRSSSPEVKVVRRRLMSPSSKAASSRATSSTPSSSSLPPSKVVYAGSPGGPPRTTFFELMDDFFDEPEINIVPDEVRNSVAQKAEVKKLPSRAIRPSRPSSARQLPLGSIKTYGHDALNHPNPLDKEHDSEHVEKYSKTTILDPQMFTPDNVILDLPKISAPPIVVSDLKAEVSPGVVVSDLKSRPQDSESKVKALNNKKYPVKYRHSEASRAQFKTQSESQKGNFERERTTSPDFNYGKLHKPNLHPNPAPSPPAAYRSVKRPYETAVVFDPVSFHAEQQGEPRRPTSPSLRPGRGSLRSEILREGVRVETPSFSSNYEEHRHPYEEVLSFDPPSFAPENAVSGHLNLRSHPKFGPKSPLRQQAHEVAPQKSLYSHEVVRPHQEILAFDPPSFDPEHGVSGHLNFSPHPKFGPKSPLSVDQVSHFGLKETYVESPKSNLGAKSPTREAHKEILSYDPPSFAPESAVRGHLNLHKHPKFGPKDVFGDHEQDVVEAELPEQYSPFPLDFHFESEVSEKKPTRTLSSIKSRPSVLSFDPPSFAVEHASVNPHLNLRPHPKFGPPHVKAILDDHFEPKGPNFFAQNFASDTFGLIHDMNVFDKPFDTVHFKDSSALDKHLQGELHLPAEHRQHELVQGPVVRHEARVDNYKKNTDYSTGHKKSTDYNTDYKKSTDYNTDYEQLRSQDGRSVVRQPRVDPFQPLKRVDEREVEDADIDFPHPTDFFQGLSRPQTFAGFPDFQDIQEASNPFDSFEVRRDLDSNEWDNENNDDDYHSDVSTFDPLSLVSRSEVAERRSSESESPKPMERVFSNELADLSHFGPKDQVAMGHMYAQVDSPDKFRLGHARGHPGAHHVERVAKRQGRSHFEEVNWHDSEGGRGQHIFDLNH